jgi:hypothetical protein
MTQTSTISPAAIGTSNQSTGWKTSRPGEIPVIHTESGGSRVQVGSIIWTTYSRLSPEIQAQYKFDQDCDYSVYFDADSSFHSDDEHLVTLHIAKRHQLSLCDHQEF